MPYTPPHQQKPTLHITGTLTLTWDAILTHYRNTNDNITAAMHETIRVTGITQRVLDHQLAYLVDLACQCGHLDLEYDTDGLDLVERLTPLIDTARNQDVPS